MVKILKTPIVVTAHMPTKSAPPTPPKAAAAPDFLRDLSVEAEIVSRLTATPEKMHAAMFKWIKTAGENMDHPSFSSTNTQEVAKKSKIVEFAYSFACYIAKQLEKSKMPQSRETLAVLAIACNLAATHVAAGVKKSEKSIVSLSEEISGIVQNLDQRNDLTTFPSDALLDMAATLRHGCTKLPDQDFGDILGFTTWKKIVGILCDRMQTLQRNPYDYAPKRTVAEIRSMKSYIRGKPLDEPERVDELSSLPKPRIEKLQEVQGLERRVIERPSFGGGALNTIAAWCGRGPVRTKG